MTLTPYAQVPKGAFFLRTLPAALLILGLSFLVVGLEGQQQFLKAFSEIPSYCWTGNRVNQFQTEKCNALWTQLGTTGLFASIPLMSVAIFYLRAFDQLNLIYRRGRKRIGSGKALIKATVVEPLEMKQDFFAWFYGLRVFLARFPDRTRAQVYLPSHADWPQVGDFLVVCDAGRLAGQKRYLGLLYTPHVAVVSGTQRD